MHVSTCADRGSNPCHDERNGEEGDDGTACRQCDGECHIASCQHGKHIARTAARAAGNEHDAEEKEGFAKLAVNDFETVQSLINSRPAKASTTLREMQAHTATAAPAGRENWTYLEWMKKDPEGLKRMKTENPTEFERLQKTIK